MSESQLRALIWAARCSGLLPFAIGFQPLQARSSRRAALYSFVFGASMLTCVTYGLAHLLWNRRADLGTRHTLLSTTALSWLISVLRMYCIFYQLLRRRSQLVRLFNRMLGVRALFGWTYGGVSFAEAPFLDRQCRRLAAWKLGSVAVQSVVIGLALVYYDIGGAANPLWRVVIKIVVFFGSDLLILVYTTIHFAVLLVALQLFRDCNARLIECVRMMRELQSQSERTATLRWDRKHREVIEDIDRIALLYRKTTEYTHESNAVFALPVVMTLINCFLYILMTLYSLIHDVSKLAGFEEDDGQSPQVIFNICSLAYFCIRVYFIVWVSDAVIEEANKTLRILGRSASLRTDKASNECIQLFSLNILQYDKLMVACGMISVDKSLIYGMVGAVTSYLTILIQFDLAGNSANKTYPNVTA